MVNLINLQQYWLNDIVADELESRILDVMHNILLSTCKEIIDNNHIVSPLQEPVNQMAAHKSSAPCDNYSQRLPPHTHRDLGNCGCLLNPRIFHSFGDKFLRADYFFPYVSLCKIGLENKDHSGYQHAHQDKQQTMFFQ